MKIVDVYVDIGLDRVRELILKVENQMKVNLNILL